MLTEQLLHGLNDREMCNEIIAKKPETFNAAYEIASSLETTSGSADEVMKQSSGPSSILSKNALLSAPIQRKVGKQRNKQ